MDPILLVIVIMAVAFVAMSMMNRKKMRQSAENLKTSLVPGDRVMTTAGLHATVVAVGEKTVELMIADNVVTTWDLRAIMQKIDETPVAPDFVGDFGDDNISENDDIDTPGSDDDDDLGKDNRF